MWNQVLYVQLYSPSSPPARSKIRQKIGVLLRSISQTTITVSSDTLETRGETNTYWALLNVGRGILLINPGKWDFNFPRMIVIDSKEVGLDPTFLADSKSIFPWIRKMVRMFAFIFIDYCARDPSQCNDLRKRNVNNPG